MHSPVSRHACYGEHHHGLLVPVTQRRALVNKLNLCNLADGGEEEPQSPRGAWCTRIWRFPEPGGNTVITARKSELTAYSGKQLVLLYGWWSWCMGPLSARSSHSLSAEWWIASILWAIGKGPGHTRSHLNSSFPFSPCSIFFGTSQINCIVFPPLSLFCPSLPFLPSFLPHVLPSLSLYLHDPYSLYVTFNELKGMQECTGNTWQSTFERLRLTESRWLCLPSFFPFLFPPPPPLCVRLPKQEAAGTSVALEVRLESDVNWAGDWFVDRKCLKMEDGVEAEGETGWQMNNEREGHG